MCPEDSAPSQLRSAKSQPPEVQSPGQVGPVGDLRRPGTQHSPPLPPLPFVRPSSVRDKMDSPDESAAASRHGASSPAREGAEDDVASKKATIRKRTKTGCLTCRKRRIKCDEGRPVCSNCIKSKRQCEGYNQRVIFKDPLGTFAPFGRMSSVVYPQPSPQALVREQQLSVAQQKSSSQSLQIIAPKPPPLGFNHHGAFPPPVALFNGQQVASPSLPLNFDPSLYGLSAVPPTPKYTFSSSEAIGAFPRGSWRHGAQPTAHLEHPSEPLHANLEAASLTADTGHDAHHHVPPDVSLQQSISFLDKGKANAGVPSQLGHWDYPVSEDDDASIAGSDDDTSMGQSELAVPLDDLGLIVSQRAHDRFDLFATQPRTFSVHPDVGVLSSYEADFATSPLLNRQNSVIFWHFVNVTGPSMSMYERNSLDTVPTHQHGTSVQAHRHLWSYIFPILSFSHAALLQAILALGGLQIAKLQGVPPTTSLKHYHLSLRRVARNIGRPNKRAQPANLAATLLLAYYEVWNSDHEKWSKHLLGARWIIRDINFRQMTRHMMKIKERSRLRRSQAAQVQQQQIPGHPFPPGLAATYGIFDSGHTHSHDQHNTEPDPLYSDWDLVNVPLLTIIMGRDVSYQELGVGRDEDFPGYGRWDTLTEKDMERYERFSDLYWWYCKMDVYQSVLGGTKLFMDYDLWTQCPPRAPMGRLDAVYGTYDHLMLLLGRLTNFASRDLPRKRRAFMLKGTFGGNGAPPGSFPGMMPASSRVAMPMGFSPPREGYSPQSDSLDDADLEALTAQAYRDWESIKAAFEAIREHFGSDFQPLAQDLAPMIHTPFGPAAQYRTYSIAGIWMNYYMGLIVLHRAHPEMPPVAMMAAGMSSSDTMGYATEIGRIAAGLEEDLEAKEVISTLVGAAFIECAFPLFVAGVQYQYDPQRHWLVRRMHSIARLTGWQSARQIADGCESAWTKAASMGQGQPYMRAPEMDAMENAMENAMQPVWTTQSRRLDHRIHEVETGEDSSARKIVLAKSEQAHYALGLLGVQEDFELLDLEDAGNEAK